MNFEEAMVAMRAGKKVKRQHWRNDCYLYINTNRTLKVLADASDISTNIASHDALSEDWEILHEPKTLGQIAYESFFADAPNNTWEAASGSSKDSWNRAVNAVIKEHEERQSRQNCK